MFWKDCLLGRIHFSNERFSCQSLFCNDACLATSIFLTRSFQLIWAKENFRLAPSRISWQKVLSDFNICLENTHPGLFLPLSCRWNYQSSVQVEKETNKQRTPVQTSEEEIPNKSCMQYLLDPEMAPLFPKYHYCGLYHTAYIEHRYKQRR